MELILTYFSSRMNREMASSMAGMNPPAPGPTGAGPAGVGDQSTGGATDFAALLQYLQHYQKQMGTDGK